MTKSIAFSASRPKRGPFLLGVFLLTFSVLVFQIVQTRILSVIVWYYMAFFAISVAMLGMTAGAVWVYLKYREMAAQDLSATLSNTTLLTAICMPLSVIVQLCLVTSLLPTLTTVFAWTLLTGAMTVPYVFAGIAVSLALTRSPFNVSEVYGVDLLGAALGCAVVIGILNVLDGPSAVLLSGLIVALAAWCFALAGSPSDVAARISAWRHPLMIAIGLAVLLVLNIYIPVGLKPLLVKDSFESAWLSRVERWNTYSRVVAYPPRVSNVHLWGPSPLLDKTLAAPQATLNIDGAASTVMYKFDSTGQSLDFLRFDLVNLAYYLPGIEKAAIIGVGGGRDLFSAHLFGVGDITGVELNPIFIELHTKHPFYSSFSNLRAVPGLTLHVDDARSWFASTSESFDLIQMSMIDTWAATGAGAFSLSENGLYTLQGWGAFVRRLNGDGVFTVSRWYSPHDLNETGRMIALALGVLMDLGVANPRQHVFVSRAVDLATLVLSRTPFTAERVKILRQQTERLGFQVLISPDTEPEPKVLREVLGAKDIAGLNRAASHSLLDLSVPTDNRPFFFNQLRFSDIPQVVLKVVNKELSSGIISGNLRASITLVLILLIALVAVVCTIVVPLFGVARLTSRTLLVAGTIYFALIGMGFMFAEISLLQYFSLFLGHPVYALGVCLFSLILSTGLGSFASGAVPLDTSSRVAIWGLLIGGYLLLIQGTLANLFETTTALALPIRVLICIAVVTPGGFLMGFAFPTGMTLVGRIDREPAPWFWGINGATGVLASVLAVMIGISFGINITMVIAALCYLAIIPTAGVLLALSKQSTNTNPLLR